MWTSDTTDMGKRESDQLDGARSAGTQSNVHQISIVNINGYGQERIRRIGGKKIRGVPRR
jgi:hypothetical protein